MDKNIVLKLFEELQDNIFQNYWSLSINYSTLNFYGFDSTIINGYRFYKLELEKI